MTIRQDIEREAGKLGSQSAKRLPILQTGMQVNIDIEWAAAQQISDQSPAHLVGRVVVHVGGLTVEA